MGNNNKSYRIRTTVGRESDSFLDIHLDQDYDSLEILSLKISDKDVYKLHNSDYGVVVGRVLANGNFGVPNAKISVFIPADEQNSDMKVWNLYPYTSTSTRNNDNIRYNLLPDKSVKDCHKAVGTFPNKTFLLENDSLLEVFDDYYLYTTRTNAAGDYIICGVPTGMQTIHMDLDLSDCGILSQRPRDFVYKGYTVEQFENPNQFKKDENLDSLSQIFSQNQPVYVNPFWGNEDNGEEIGITRADIEISFKFEPTCVFMGSAISDNVSNGVGKKCVPTNQMGAMDELTAGEGTIEMIRKTPNGNVEEFAIKGNQLINGNGVWCYQIPMNLDYMMTDEYGNMVPTDDPEKGIPTRTRVRFRASLTDMENSSQSFYRAKYLIPNNPDIEKMEVDYDFGTYTDEDSYRDLFWNGVYSVKSYIPRFQKSKRWRNERFSGIKACNYYGGNNPMPYNNLRIKLPFMFTVLCIFVKLFLKIVTLLNRLESGILMALVWLVRIVVFGPLYVLANVLRFIPLVGNKIAEALISGLDGLISDWVNRIISILNLHCSFVGDGLCPDMEGWYFAPGCGSNIESDFPDLRVGLLKNTLNAVVNNGNNPDDVYGNPSSQYTDETSIDVQSTTRKEEETACVTIDIDYLLSCFEMNLAEEYRVIKFDFYNDWVNGVLYFPRWMRKVKRKKRYRFSFSKGITTYYKDKVQGCMASDNSTVKKTRYYTQQCSIAYGPKQGYPVNTPWTSIKTSRSCSNTIVKGSEKENGIRIFPARCHKKEGMGQSRIFGSKSGLVNESTTMLGQNVYYLKPCEWDKQTNARTILFATDIILLGTLNDCDENGLPQSFKYLNNSSYIMPTNLALTTMDDDAYIYVSSDGTVCSSSNSSNGKQSPNESSTLRVTPGYESTYSAYSKTEGDVIEYGEEDDPIPVTEAAGISWNYSGPGQEVVEGDKPESPSDFMNRMFSQGSNKRYDSLYYPGGHFLGLSCINSETNIKSCVNLKRICEMGATMSQRREELRGYDDKGTPKYRYYVPTGLISNVDIEGAAFRTMFATMNHNKLVATKTNDVTGYKKYDFRFLRPDGFDGALSEIIHVNDSPYNRKQDMDKPNVNDASNFFRSLIPDTLSRWTQPSDYDPEEVEYTETRTVEDSINDYYMFRLGLSGFTAAEQKKHYLKNPGTYEHSMPQYENSFYFYFGLKDGATALDEFKKQFFSECESNNVISSPSVYIKEKISSDLTGSATIIIDNMVAPFTITVKYGSNEYTIVTSNDNIDFSDITEGKAPVVGQEYTITVVDSVEQSVTKKFTFGASAVKIDSTVVHFRKPGNVQSVNPRQGGFLKINDEVLILDKPEYISDGAIKFKYVNKDGSGSDYLREETAVTSEWYRYKDENGDNIHMYRLPKTGMYEISMIYSGNSGNPLTVFTISIEDNKNINLYASCDYLAYKEEGTTNCIPGGLKSIAESDWYNSGPFCGDTEDNWLMRHSFYRQTWNDNLAYGNFVYANGSSNIAIFGQPESGSSLNNAGLLVKDSDGSADNYYYMDTSHFQGYAVQADATFIPTMYFDWTGTARTESDGIFRNTFDAMAYVDDGRAAADVSDDNDAKITGYSYNDGVIELSYTGGDEHLNSSGHGCIVVFENGMIIFPIVTNVGTMKAYGEDIYGTLTDAGQLSTLLSKATVYPTMRVPSMYKPFYADVKAAVWNVQSLSVTTDGEGTTVLNIETLPLSYDVVGKVHNGLTFGNHFYPGVTNEAGVVEEYATYLNFKNSPKLYTTLTAETENDYTFGNIKNFNIARQPETIEDEDISKIEYSISEGFPVVPEGSNVLTERYEDGFDTLTMTDSVNLDTTFYSNLKIKVLTNNGLLDDCVLYSDASAPNEKIHVYVTENAGEILTMSSAPLSTNDYFYGTYNHNAVYDIKGKQVLVTKNGFGQYKAQFTDRDGRRKNFTFNTEEELANSGITLLHNYTVSGSLEDVVEKIEAILSDSTKYKEIQIYNKETIQGDIPDKDKFKPTDNLSGDYRTIICSYEREDLNEKNTFKVYKIYSLGSLETIYTPEIVGGEPYITAESTEISYDSNAHPDEILRVSSNVTFKASKNRDWIDLDQTAEYQPGNSEIRFSIGQNQNTDEGRSGEITLESTSESEHALCVITINQDADE